MLRHALVLAIIAVSTPAAAADSDTASNLDSWDGLTLLAFAILLFGLFRLAVPEKRVESSR